jgi:hypothetical protein
LGFRLSIRSGSQNCRFFKDERDSEVVKKLIVRSWCRARIPIRNDLNSITFAPSDLLTLKLESAAIRVSSHPDRLKELGDTVYHIACSHGAVFARHDPVPVVYLHEADWDLHESSIRFEFGSPVTDPPVFFGTYVLYRYLPSVLPPPHDPDALE